jgi:hypothetical protein
VGWELARQGGLTRHVYGVYLTANRAEALMRLGRFSEAYGLLSGAIDPGPARSVIHGLLMTQRAMTAALCGRHEDAARDIDAASAEAGLREEVQFALAFELGRASVSDYQVTATVTVSAYGYGAEFAQCTNPADTVTGGGMSDSLYLGSSGALLESFPTTERSLIVGGGYDQAWQVDVNNNYSQPEQFTVYAICQHTNGS